MRMERDDMAMRTATARRMLVSLSTRVSLDSKVFLRLLRLLRLIGLIGLIAWCGTPGFLLSCLLAEPPSSR